MFVPNFVHIGPTIASTKSWDKKKKKSKSTQNYNVNVNVNLF